MYNSRRVLVPDVTGRPLSSRSLELHVLAALALLLGALFSVGTDTAFGIGA